MTDDDPASGRYNTPLAASGRKEDEGWSRRGMLVALGGIGAASAVESGTARQSKRKQSWPQFGYDAASTGYSPENIAPIGNINTRWKAQIVQEVDNQYELSSPTVSGSVLVVGTQDGSVVAVDTNDGSERWRVELGDYVWGTPVIYNDTVIVGTVNGQPDNNGVVTIEGGSVHALGVSSGQEQWSKNLASSVNYAPVVADNTVFVPCLGEGVYAIDLRSGDEQWFAETTDLIEVSPAYDGGSVFVGDNSDNAGNIYSFDSADGSQRWKAQTAGSVLSSPAISSSTIYVGDDNGTVHALDTTDGTVEWTFEARTEVRASPAIANGTVYVGDKEVLYALNASDGTKKWESQIEGPENSHVVSPAVVGGTVYTAADRGSENAVVGLNTNDGAERWRFVIPDGICSTPAIAGGTLYFTCQATLYAISGDTTKRSTQQGERGTPTVETPTESQKASYFEQLSENKLPIALAAAGLLGGAGISAYRRLTNNDEQVD